MKKTLLIAAAALVAGVISSEAQVYSVNIVGYVNYISKTNSPGFEMIANPLDNGTNTIKSLWPTTVGGTQIQLWNPGAGSFDIYTFSAAQGGHWKLNGVTTDTTLIPPGTGYFITPAGTSPITNTFVGNVVPTGTGVMGTNFVASGFQCVSSLLPIADAVTNPATINMTGVVGGYQLQFWNVANQSFDIYTYSAAQGGHWKLNGVNTTPVLTVNQGFFFNNNGATTYNWVQTGL